MIKELALAVNFAKAPVEVQNAAKALYDALKKVDTIKAAIEAKIKDLELAETAVGDAQRSYSKALNGWNVTE